MYTPSAPVALGDTLIYFVVDFVVQTFVFGCYTVLMIFSTRMLMKRELKTRAYKTMLIITVLTYLLSAMYWGYSFANVTTRIQIFIDNPQVPQASTGATKYNVIFNAVSLINFVLSDGVVVWRARLICAPEHRKYMYLPLFFIVLTSFAVIALIILRIVDFYDARFRATRTFITVIDVLQLCGMGVSFISNLTTTGVVGVTAWQHRAAIRDGFNKTTQGSRILLLLLESGVLYCLLGLFTLFSSLIRLPYNTLGDLYGPVSIQLVGAYTPTLLLLINAQRPLSDTSFLGSFDLEAPPANAHSALHVHVTAATPVVAANLNWSALDPKQFVAQPRASESSQDTLGSSGNPREHEKGHKYQLSDATLVSSAQGR